MWRSSYRWGNVTWSVSVWIYIYIYSSANRTLISLSVGIVYTCIAEHSRKIHKKHDSFSYTLNKYVHFIRECLCDIHKTHWTFTSSSLNSFVFIQYIKITTTAPLFYWPRKMKRLFLYVLSIEIGAKSRKKIYEHSVLLDFFTVSLFHIVTNSL